jgi:hypothetical protein
MTNGTESTTRHGRYHAEPLVAAPETGVREGVQRALDRGARRGWNLVGAVNGAGAGEVILVWDTERPNLGRPST